MSAHITSPETPVTYAHPHKHWAEGDFSYLVLDITLERVQGDWFGFWNEVRVSTARGDLAQGLGDATMTIISWNDGSRSIERRRTPIGTVNLSLHAQNREST